MSHRSTLSTMPHLSLQATRDLWLGGLRSGWVVGFLAGPPCETWSDARARDLHDDPPSADRRQRRRPRVVRACTSPLGAAGFNKRQGLKQTLFWRVVLQLESPKLPPYCAENRQPISQENSRCAIWRQWLRGTPCATSRPSSPEHLAAAPHGTHFSTALLLIPRGQAGTVWCNVPEANNAAHHRASNLCAKDARGHDHAAQSRCHLHRTH